VPLLTTVTKLEVGVIASDERPSLAYISWRQDGKVIEGVETDAPAKDEQEAFA
jgi:hypothetical protein